MKAKAILLSVVLLPLLSASLYAQKVNIDFDKSANFSSFKTYTWIKGTPAKNPLMDERIIAAIDKQLAAKGMTRVDASKNPDLSVVYHAAVDVETVMNTTDTGWGWGYYGGSSITTVDKIPVGTLVVDMEDMKAKKLAWRGQASDTLSDKPEKVEKKIDQIATKMFKKYPPEIKDEAKK